MREYIIKQIKDFKIKNSVTSPLLIHEFHEFEYENIKYVSIYIYCKEKIETLKINNKKPINIEQVNDDIISVIMLKEDIKEELFITEFTKEGKIVKIDNKQLIDYDDYILDEKNLEILRKINLKGFKNIVVIPKITKNYWICSCGNVNIENECSVCKVKKQFNEYYDTEEKIQKKYAMKIFEQTKFSTDNQKDAIKKFKEKMQEENLIDTKYLDDDFFELNKDASNKKIEDYKTKKSNTKTVVRNLIIIGSVILMGLILTILFILNNQNNEKKSVVSKYCENDNFVTYKNLKDTVTKGNCGSFINYIDNNDLTENDIIFIISNGNSTIYKAYYDYYKVNLHEKINQNIENIAYYDYLAENNMEANQEMLDYILSKQIFERNLEGFKKYVSLVPKEGWSNDFKYFDYVVDEKGETVYNGDYNKVFELHEYVYSYHKTTGDLTCTVADLGSKENIKYLIENKNDSVCEYTLSTKLKQIDSSVITNYKEAGGSFKYNGYLGNFIHHFVKEELPYDEYKEKINLLVKYGNNINEQMKSDSAYPGLTPLDVFIKENSSICRDASSSYSSTANKVKQCNEYKQYYKILKSYGAKCNKNCVNESYFK